MSRRGTIWLVGAGNMGRALLRGWLANGWPPEAVHVIDPDETARRAVQSFGVAATPARPRSPSADTVLLAVKPQQLQDVLPDYRDLAASRSLFLSIAAGKPIAFYESILGAETAIVRGMPNTPSAVGQGVTVLVSNPAVDRTQGQRCESLMAAVGQVVWLEDEGLMNAVTAVSGSGTAYVFLLIECLAAAAVEAGFDEGLANRLAVATVAGSGVYASAAGVDAEELRRRVTSPGGVTEAALEVLAGEGGLKDLISGAVRAGAKRGRELA